MPEILDPTDNPLAALNRRVMDACYSHRATFPPTISDYVRQRLADDPAKVVKLIMELDDCRVLLECLASQTVSERTAALDFHQAQTEDVPFDENTDE